MNLQIGKKTINILYLNIFLLAFIRGLGKIYIFSNNGILIKSLSLATYITYLLFAFCIIKQRYTLKELTLVVIFGLFGIVILYTTGEALVLSVILVLAASRKRDFTIICKMIFKGILLSFLIAVILYALKISDSGMQRRDAIALGYGSPNVCAMILQLLVYLVIAVQKDKLSKKEWGMVIGAFIINFVFLDSRTTGILMLLLPVFELLFRKIYSHRHVIIRTAHCMFPFILLVFMYYVSVHRGEAAYTIALDDLFNGRLTLNQYNLYNLGITMWGQEVIIDKSYIAVNTIDGSYVLSLIQCGIIATVVIFSCYSILIYKVIKKRKYNLLAVISALLLCGMMENLLLDIIFGFPLIWLVTDCSKTVRISKEI